jgi:hypothetical protein
MREQVKVSFSHFWPGFSADQFRSFFPYVYEKYDLVLSQAPEVVFHSVFAPGRRAHAAPTDATNVPRIKPGNYVRVFMTGENAEPCEQIHHTPLGVPLEEMFSLRHRVELAPGGILQRIFSAASILIVSAHFQGIDRIGEKLEVEATSTDGIVEAIRPSSGERMLAVQWHPEWRIADNPDSIKLLSWFGRVVRGASVDEAVEGSRGTAA